MIAIATILFAFPLGFFLRHRLAAVIAFVAIFGHLYTFQTPYVIDTDTTEWSYLLVTSLIYAAGFGLVMFGHRVGQRRRGRTTYHAVGGTTPDSV
jgi:hypothetical protein